ncbi:MULTISPECIES: sulfurtransferase complex subunit TusD [unclassified Pseudoalteromonas]|uniref:sulfurtransferase complex subunit TusD n=1 Tax=unclassified Pseudoalteromonas TaxID=194690 RepID=UPI000CF62A92|nr:MULTISPECIES: sulfurtransferase complex subunit TusD [unclassified Pseudoalteromonas]
MASFVLSLHSAPSDTDTLNALGRFATSALAQGHTIRCIFLYQDGVYHASPCFDLASDEFDPAKVWQDLHKQGIELHLCVTAATKRGIDLDQCKHFSVSGLAEFAMEAAQADRWVQFK